MLSKHRAAAVSLASLIAVTGVPLNLASSPAAAQGAPSTQGVGYAGVWRPSNGYWYLPGGAQQWGEGGDVPVAGDYNGDRTSDLAVWRPRNGTWWIINSATGGVRTQQWGEGGDVPLPGQQCDVGIGKAADFIVWRPSNGTFYLRATSSGAVSTQKQGVGGDIPVRISSGCIN